MFFKHGLKLSVPIVLFTLIQVWEVQVFADTLTIETTTSVRVTDGLMTVDVTVTNKGNADARDVRVHLRCLGRRRKARIKPILKSGTSDTVTFEQTVSGARKGRYPLTIQVDFHDAKQYPFSALSGRTFSVGGDVDPDLEIIAKDIMITEKGKLRYEITNLNQEPRKIRASLVLPKELSTPKPFVDFAVAGRTKERLTFDIGHFSALNASYPVFCYFEFDAGDAHYTTATKAVVTVMREENWFRRTRRVWIFAGCILAVLFVVSVVKDKIKNRKSRGPSA